MTFGGKGVRPFLQLLFEDRTDKIQERTLCGTYIDSTFRPIIEDTDKGKQFSW